MNSPDDLYHKLLTGRGYSVDISKHDAYGDVIFYVTIPGYPQDALPPLTVGEYGKVKRPSASPLTAMGTATATIARRPMPRAIARPMAATTIAITGRATTPDTKVGSVHCRNRRRPRRRRFSFGPRLTLTFDGEPGSWDTVLRLPPDSGQKMLLGCIADDFTGATDLANTLAKGGMATVQFVGIPAREAGGDCEAGVVALKTRSIPAKEAVAESLTALEWLRGQACRQFLFKYCSTFDSTPEGNIGPVAEALLDALDAPVAVVCPVFPATGRTLFMGHLFVQDRLLSESGMEKHPLNPMTDPDIRRWLRLQTRGEVGLIPYGVVRQGAAAIRAGLAAEAARDHRLVVVDAVTDGDLVEIGTAAADHKLITGGSGIAMGLPENFRRAGLLGSHRQVFAGRAGPGVVLSGSCSRRLARAGRGLPRRPSRPAGRPRRGHGRRAHRRRRGRLRAGKDRAVADRLFDRRTRRRGGGAGAPWPRRGPRPRSSAFFGELALAAGRNRRHAHRRRRRRDRRRGGDRARCRALRIGPEIDPGVPALAADGKKPVLLALKSGNFGAPDFYAKALRILEAA